MLTIDRVNYDKDILDEIFKIEYEAFFGKSDLYSIKDLEYMLNNNDYKVYLLKNNNTILGYSIYLVNIFDAELLKIAIKKGEQSKGYAYELLKKSMKDINKKELFLEVRKSNIYAINLYKKLGYSIISMRKNLYVYPVEDGYVMIRKEN